MGLLEKLKSALGLDGARSSDHTGSGDVDVTVEREPSTEVEDAVKGTETAATTPESEGSGVENEVVEADTEAEADTERGPDAATEAVSGTAETDADDSESEPEPTAEEESESATSGASVGEGSSDPVTELNGIGPAYAERLHGLDIETVGELAVADAEDIAERTDLGEKRVADWIEQANSY